MAPSKRPTLRKGRLLSSNEREAIEAVAKQISKPIRSPQWLADHVQPLIEGFSAERRRRVDVRAEMKADEAAVKAIQTVINRLHDISGWATQVGYDEALRTLVKEPGYTFRDYLDGLGPGLRRLQVALRNRANDLQDEQFWAIMKNWDGPAKSAPLTMLMLRLADLWHAVGGSVGSGLLFHEYLSAATTSIRLMPLERSRSASLARLWRRHRHKPGKAGRPPKSVTEG